MAFVVPCTLGHDGGVCWGKRDKGWGVCGCSIMIWKEDSENEAGNDIDEEDTDDNDGDEEEQTTDPTGDADAPTRQERSHSTLSKQSTQDEESRVGGSWASAWSH
jgi:hypothetical protein